PNDPYFLSAVQSGKSVLDAFPSSPTAKTLLTIADQLTARIPAPQPGI
ncbi:MAG: MinD/ParA family protein, partial [Methylococcaceae bacterium]|nr:MinD/ParA family protein [Methylococcaceae bacterium]